ncbi:MAG: cytochrome P450 [Candidatus Tectimicrobiota bacterium]
MPPHKNASGPGQAGCALTTLPGPRGLPFLGNVLQLRPTKLHTILEQWADIYGPFYRFRLARKPVVVIAEPTLIQEVLRQRPETYRRLSSLAAVFEDLGGQGVFVAEGPRWRRQRRVVMQALSTVQLRRFFPTVMAVTARLKRRWDHAARVGDLLDMPTELRRYTAEITTYLTFGEAMSTVEDAWEGLHQHLAHILPTINRRGNALVPYWHVFPLPADRACARALAALQAVMIACIAHGRACLAEDPTRATHPTTILEGFLAARDEEGAAFSETEILSNLLTMLVAGEDTTAHTMAWMLHFMTDVPAVQRLMQHEVDDVLGEASMLPDVQAQERLGYLNAVTQETMRLKSVAPLLCFEPLHPVELGGIHLPVGTGVFLLTRHVGLQEQAFRAAGQFQPARWLLPPGQPIGDPAAPGLIPFGGGPRVCPGRALAFLEIHAVMAMLCRNFTVTKPSKAPPVREHFAFTMMPQPLRLHLHTRV